MNAIQALVYQVDDPHEKDREQFMEHLLHDVRALKPKEIGERLKYYCNARRLNHGEASKLTAQVTEDLFNFFEQRVRKDIIASWLQ